ncbi:MAG: hypothetical protein ACK502_02200 [Alphaproteobacteria bacterium]
MSAEPNLPTAKAMMLNPNNIGDEQAQPDEAANTRRNAEFDKKMQEFNAAENKDIMDTNLSTEDYLKRMYDREQQEYAELQKWKDDPSLSENQRAELGARIKMLDYSRESQQIMDAYEKDPNNPALKEKYDAREAELKEYRVLMENSEEFKNSDSMEKMIALETKLDNAKTLEDKNAVKMEMAEEMREFKKELMNDPKGMDKIISFVEKNSGNAVIQKTGMIEMVGAIKGRKAEMGQDKEEGLEDQQVTPNKAAKAGVVDADAPMAEDAAKKEVAATNDNGRDGQIAPVRMDVANATEIQVNAGGPGQQRENVAGLA